MSLACDVDAELQAHIRSMLLEYALSHLAVDHIAYTQDGVSELLAETLTPISLVEPGIVTLPIDPLSSLLATWRTSGGGNLEPYTQLWDVPGEVKQYIGSELRRRKPRDDSHLFDDDSDVVFWERPLTPVLTRRAMKSTPRPGANRPLEKLPQSNDQLIDRLGLISLSDTAIGEDTEETEAVDVDKTLSVRLVIPQPMHDPITNLVRSIPFAYRGSAKASAASNANALEFIRAESPPLPAGLLRSLSPPLFPRKREIRTRSGQVLGVNEMADVQKLMRDPGVKVEIDESREKDELDNASLVIVDGWHAIRDIVPSSPPVPSLDLDNEPSEIDELDDMWEASPSPEVPYGDQTLVAAKQDDVIFPRTEWFGGHDTHAESVPEESLADHLAPFILPVPVQTPKQERIRRLSPPISPSLLGQPPTEIDAETNPDDDCNEDDAQPDRILKRLCKPVRGLAPESWIVDERIDEDEALLMDVPNLPPPNVRVGEPNLPLDMRSLLAPAMSTKKGAPVDVQRSAGVTPLGLSRVAGLKSLNIELAWRPFVGEQATPTLEEIASVEDVASGAELCGPDSEQQNVESYIAQLTRDNAPSSRDAFAVDRGETAEAEKRAGVKKAAVEPLLLTREERRRMAGRSAESDMDVRIVLDDVVTAEQKPGGSGEGTTPSISALPSMGAAVFSHRDRPGQTGAKHPRSRSATPSQQNYSLFPPVDPSLRRAHEPHAFSGDDVFADLGPTSFNLGESRVDYDEPPPRKIARWDEGVEERTRSSGIRDIEADRHEQDWLIPSDSHPAVTDSDQDGYLYPSLEPTPEGLNPAGLRDEELTAGGPYQIQPISTSVLAPAPVPAGLMPVEDEDNEMSRTLIKAATFSARSRLAQFMKVRGRATATNEEGRASGSPPTEEDNDPVEAVRAQSESPPPAPQVIPEELIDNYTLVLPPSWDLPTTAHRYLASIPFIQKCAITKHLKTTLAVELVERDALNDGADLVLDPHTAIIYFVLAELPTRVDVVVEKLSRLSWCYAQLVVIFEGYSPSQSYFADSNQNRRSLLAFSPPVVKAIKKLRRDLGIAEGLGGKNPGTEVRLGYALNAYEAALFARMVGNVLERNALEMEMDDACLWGDRAWLSEDDTEEERDLAGVAGMNLFAAMVVLSQVELGAFIEMEPETRLAQFGGLIGTDRVGAFNTKLARRMVMVSSP
ncbi:hypothetical protein BOTBODRAFT_281522 [Botryobasidium botryosum FD-172 SS1]|uniref:SAM-like domain-containing protein n=1 Tax=Botryobasidium botryosum (strain FD-172 SS1) TaxID=930990 RepID=A0A067MVH3_BOTB1|nr:hypothetical protein BOTBODRAFT_281522 [Botryobasidium botryosum FD-172 SS1]